MKQLKKIFGVILLVLLANACSKDDDTSDSGDDPAEDIFTTASTDVSTFQIVNLKKTSNINLSQSYDGTFDEEPLTLNKATDSTLVFVVPAVEAGVYALSIPNLDFELDFTVTETILSDTPENILTGIEDEITTFSATVVDSTENQAELASAINSLTSLLDNATDTEKEELSLYYEANKETFDAILNLEIDNGRQEACLLCASDNVKFSVAVLAFAGGVLVASAGVTPLERALAATVAVVGWTKARSLLKKITNERLKVIGTVIATLEEEINGGRISNSTLSLVNGNPAILSFATNSRSITTADRSESDSDFIDFFSAFDRLNSSITLLNEIITAVNSLPFVNIDLIDLSTIPASVESAPESVDAEVYDNFSFAIENTAIELTTKFIEAGKMEVTLTADNSVDLSSELTTDLTISYQDDFNDLSETVDITLSESPFIEGNWTASHIDYTPVDEWVGIEFATCEGSAEITTKEERITEATMEIGSSSFSYSYQLAVREFGDWTCENQGDVTNQTSNSVSRANTSYTLSQSGNVLFTDYEGFSTSARVEIIGDNKMNWWVDEDLFGTFERVP
ncbi:MAG: hypothetical protein KI790_02565 [Cyclobacteriaceae bacterium]|nr:hypothetical protein [Cyclobacteriaceae bacterium HetDA_MAG_MS6]